MKKSRQDAIGAIIAEKAVGTQEELLEELNSRGYHTTQATISRDIREMRLVKTQDAGGEYRYAVQAQAEGQDSRFLDVFVSSVLSVDQALNQIVIKCSSGMASGACAALDSMEFPSVVGTLAGDDTIFVLTRSEAAAGQLVAELSRILGS